MNIKSFRVGPLSTNSYLVWDNNKEAVLIDAGGGVEIILRTLEESNLHLRYIINTHGHYDHIAANKEIAESSGAQVLVHEADADYLTDANLNLAGFFAPKFYPRPADRLLMDGETISCGELVFHVIHTPGHTPGGICLLIGEVLFTGDTLFARSIGRSDLVGGDSDLLLRSLKEKLLPLDDALTVYPGHGEATTLGREKKENPYLRN